MSYFIKQIKQSTRDYCKQNVAYLPVNKEYMQLKAELVITSFYELPESYQERLRAFVESQEPQKVYLVGSLASGAGIIPGITPARFIELRERHSYKTRKTKSDIDLYMLDAAGEPILHREKSDIVNIESLPSRFDPAHLIYENGTFL